MTLLHLRTKNSLRLLVITLTLSIYSCKDEPLNPAKVNAIDFLNKNSIFTDKLHSETFELFRNNMGLSNYSGLNAKYFFEAHNDLSFRFIARASDCNFFEIDQSFTMITLSNTDFEEVYFSDIDSINLITKQYDDPFTSTTRDYYELLIFINKEAKNITGVNHIPGLTFEKGICDYSLEDILSKLETDKHLVHSLRLISFDESDLREFEKHLRFLSDL
jgi:hypothetical protein